MAVDITELCWRNITDKHHGEFPHSDMYDVLFSSLRDKPITLLEIGVNKGGSIAVWEAYFPNATLLATDVNPKCLIRNTERTTVTLVDQFEPDQLRTYADANGPFDVVIDDGSHYSSHQILTLETLWPYMKPGGIFIIEDTMTSYVEKYVRAEGPGFPFVEYCKGLIDTSHQMIEDRDALWKDLHTITFKQDMVVLTKREEPKRRLIDKGIPKDQGIKGSKKAKEYRDALKRRYNGTKMGRLGNR